MKEYLEINLPAILNFATRVLLAAFLFFVGRAVIHFIRRIVKRSMERVKADKGVVQFVDSLLKFGLYALLIFMIAAKMGVEPSSVAALIASGGVAVGFALQGSLSNFAGGVLILLLRPFVVGDYIIENSGKAEGTVKEIQVFYTKLSTIDNKTIVIPNGSLANSTLINVTGCTQRQLDLRVGIGYEADLKKAKRLIEDILGQDMSIIHAKSTKVFVESLGESAVVLGVRAWVKTSEYLETKWRLLEKIKLTFDSENIEIPYNQVTVHLRGEK